MKLLRAALTTAMLLAPGTGVGLADTTSANKNSVEDWLKDAKHSVADGAFQDYFGTNLAIDGNTLIVGALSLVAGTGSLHIFERDSAGDWAYVTELPGSGRAVAISGDTIVVHAFGGDSSAAGAVDVFERDEGGGDAWGHVATLRADTPMVQDEFGNAVGIDDDLITVGSPNYDDGLPTNGAGAVFVFERLGGPTPWVPVARLDSVDFTGDGEFGAAVSISGTTIAVSDPARAATGFGPGAAYVFERDTVDPGTWQQVARLTDGSSSHIFGLSVSISDNTVIVGDSQHYGFPEGSALVFERDHGGAGNWGLLTELMPPVSGWDAYVSSVALDGDTAAVGALIGRRVYMFEREQGGPNAWGQTDSVSTVNGSALDRFGAAVALSGSLLAVGSPQDDVAAVDSGSAYTFERAVCPELVLDKQVSCDGGATWRQTCTGYDAPGISTVQVRYVAHLPVDAPLFNCVLSDSNSEVLALPVDVGTITGALPGNVVHMTDLLSCSEDLQLAEPNTATLNCECNEEGSGPSRVDVDLSYIDCKRCGDGVIQGSYGETCEPSDFPSSGELIAGGGFENGPLSDWVETSTNFGQVVVPDFPFEGNYHMRIGGTDGVFEEAGASQVITLPDGPAAELRFHLRLATCSGDPEDSFEVRVNGDAVFSIDMTDDRCGYAEYRQEIRDLSAYVGQEIDLLLFGSTNNNGVDSEIFVDNVSLDVHAAVPSCRDDCTYCGDGVVDDDEDCDDGNNAVGDGCSRECLVDRPTCPVGQVFLGLLSDLRANGVGFGDGNCVDPSIIDSLPFPPSNDGYYWY